MPKIKFFFIFLFFVYNTNSQTEQLISVDSLQIIFNENYKLKKNISPKEFTITAHKFLKLLKSQRLIYKSLKSVNQIKIEMRKMIKINTDCPLRRGEYFNTISALNFKP